jgi:hypothetical protein
MPNVRLKTTYARLSAPLLVLITFLCLGHVQAQCVTYSLNDKGDTLNCVDKKNFKQGPWVVHVDPLRGEPGYEEEGLYADDVKDGKWRRYSLQGDLIAVENYKWGSRDGLQEFFTPSGDRLREESWMAVDPKNPYDTVTVYDDPHNPFRSEKKVIKLDASSVKHGTWNYYDPSTGTVAKTERYVLGKLQDGLSGGMVQVASSDSARLAVPTEVQNYNKKNSGKKKVAVRTGETGY